MPGTQLAIGEMDDAFLGTDRRIYSQMAIWALAGDDPEVARKLKELYRFDNGGAGRRIGDELPTELTKGVR